MDTNIDRRNLVIQSAGVVAAAFALTTPAAIASMRQVASPSAAGGSLAALGLPGLQVTATADTYAIDQTQIAAGRYLVSFDNQSETLLYAAFIQLDGDVTIDTVNDALAADEEEKEPPDWYYTLVSPGGVSADAGSSSVFVIDLPAGTYAVHHDTPGVPHQAVELTVTGDMPAGLSPIESPVTVTMTEMAFAVSGTITSGSQVIQFTNDGAAPHSATILGVPDGTTAEDFLDVISSFLTGSTPTTDLDPSSWVPAGDTSLMSPGATIWTDLAFEAGTYVLACFVLDAETGSPHIMLGMIDTIIVD